MGSTNYVIQAPTGKLPPPPGGALLLFPGTSDPHALQSNAVLVSPTADGSRLP